MHRLTPAIGAIVLCAPAAPIALAQDAVFDFEDQNLQTLPDAVSFVNNGITIEFATEPTGELSIGQTSAFPPSFGTRGLFIGQDDFPATPAATALNFGGGAQGVRFSWGDVGGDTDNITFTAFTGSNGTGSILQTDSFTYTGAFPSQVPVYELIFLAPTNQLGSIVITGTGFGGGPSIYVDNIEVFIPTPGVVAVLGLGGLLATRRTR
ncbi:MAG: hypothetical protein AAF297_00635 [Planctomycetota bacterium]